MFLLLVTTLAKSQEIWRRNADDYDAPYTLRFVYKRRVYAIDVQNLGDWYDVESVLRLLNFALKTCYRKA